jgi:acyl-CoA thioesterase
MKNYSVQDLKKVVEQGLQPPNCDVTMNVEVTEARDGVAHGSWQIDSAYINGHGVVMGGFVSAAADIVMAYAIASCLKEPFSFSTINLQTTFHRPTLKGEARIEARVERLGRTVAYLEADVYQHMKKVASCTSSVLIIEVL